MQYFGPDLGAGIIQAKGIKKHKGCGADALVFPKEVHEIHKGLLCGRVKGIRGKIRFFRKLPIGPGIDQNRRNCAEGSSAQQGGAKGEIALDHFSRGGHSFRFGMDTSQMEDGIRRELGNQSFYRRIIFSKEMNVVRGKNLIEPLAIAMGERMDLHATAA